MGWLFCNNYNGAVRTAFNSAATAIEIEPEIPLAANNFVDNGPGTGVLKLTLVDGATREIVEVTGVTHQTGYTQCTVVRAQEGTTAVSWAVAKKAQARVTAEEMLEFAVATAEVNNNLVPLTNDLQKGEHLWMDDVLGDSAAALTLCGAGLQSAVVSARWSASNANTTLAVTIDLPSVAAAKKTMLFVNDGTISVAVSFTGGAGVTTVGFSTINIPAGDCAVAEIAISSINGNTYAVLLNSRTFTP